MYIDSSMKDKRRMPRLFTSEVEAEIYFKQRGGTSAYQLANEFGTTAQTIYNIVKRVKERFEAESPSDRSTS